MIVYNVKARFFALQSDANDYRKHEGLKPSAIEKITITDREQLAGFLDGLFRWAKGAPAGAGSLQGPTAKTVQISSHVPDPDNAPDWVPEFIREDWRRRASYKK